MTAMAMKAASALRGGGDWLNGVKAGAAPWLDLVAGPGPIWWRITRWSQRNSH